MTAGLYHVNPETGNPNVCRAKKRCPFGGETAHWTSAAEARTAYERQVELSGMRALRGLRLSKGARLLFALDRAQQDLIAHTDGDYSYRGEAHERLRDDKIALRNRLLQKIEHDLPWDPSDEPAYDDGETVVMETRRFEGAERRQGYSNDWFEPTEQEKEVYRELDAASAAWVKRLSTAEVKAVVLYNVDATKYAKAMAGEATEIEPEFVQYFHSALAKAPRTERPFVAYAGISRERCLAVRAQCEAGVLDLTRVQSASANPAQVNGFMFQSDWQGPNDETALEFELDRAASLSAFNVHKGEMELLVPPGTYSVTGKHHGVDYVWGRNAANEGSDSFRTSETTYQLSLKETP